LDYSCHTFRCGQLWVYVNTHL